MRSVTFLTILLAAACAKAPAPGKPDAAAPAPPVPAATTSAPAVSVLPDAGFVPTGPATKPVGVVHTASAPADPSRP